VARTARACGEGQGALNPCCFQREVELGPEVPAASESESPSVSKSTLGTAHFSLLTQAEVKMSVVEVPSH